MSNAGHRVAWRCPFAALWAIAASGPVDGEPPREEQAGQCVPGAPAGAALSSSAGGVLRAHELRLPPVTASVGRAVDIPDPGRRAGGVFGSVDRLLELCPEHPYDDVVARVVMPGWHHGRTVLVGDACGAVSWLAGQGGSLAMAGALLGDVLGPVDSAAGIGQALAAFERRWKPLVDVAQASGRRAAPSFLPANRTGRPLRRWIIRGTHLSGIDRLLARMIVGRIAR